MEIYCHKSNPTLPVAVCIGFTMYGNRPMVIFMGDTSKQPVVLVNVCDFVTL